MQTVVRMSPFRCRMWTLHDRLEEHINEQMCKAEIESFSLHGQLVPVLGRELKGHPDYDAELIYGARRLFVARHLNQPLLVDLRELSDKQCIVAMDIENRQRLDISPYERGLSYARFLRTGHFASQDQLARTLGVSSSQVSRLLKLARLPSVIVNAFGQATDICEGWGLELLESWDDPHKRSLLADRARKIGAKSPRPAPADVYRELLAAMVPGRKIKKARRDDVVTGDDGAPLFRIRQQHTSILLVLPVRRMSARGLDDIRNAVSGILQRETRQVIGAQADRAALPVRNA